MAQPLTSPFTGLFVSTSRGDVVRDNVHILFCDFDLDTDKADQFTKFSGYIYELRSLLMEVLDEEEVWIIYHSVTRVLGGNHVTAGPPLPGDQRGPSGKPQCGA